MLPEIKKRSPCAGCDEVYEVDWPEAVAFYCGGDIPPGERVLIETQRLKHPRGCQTMIAEGPLEYCPKGYAPEEETTQPEASGCGRARKMLERSLHERQ